MKETLDWQLIIGYLILVFIGWLNIYASVQSAESVSIFDFGARSGKQFVWMMTAFGLAALILFVISPRIYESFSLPVYIATLVLLVSVIFLGVEVKGSRSWFEFGPVRFQPAEISKISTSLMLAAVMSQYGYKLNNLRNFIVTAAIVLVPMAIIVAQSETGSALVYCGFIFVLYREGLSGWILFMAGMAILLFILTMTLSPYMSILVLLGIVSLCCGLYRNRFRKWLMIFFPAVVLLAFLPWGADRIAEALHAGEDAFVHNIRWEYLLAGAGLCALPYFAVRAYRERSGFLWASLAAFVAGLIFIFSVDFIFHDVLQDHQRKRIEVLLGLKDDPTGVGYNVNQSMIAIGSGGLFGKERDADYLRVCPGTEYRLHFLYHRRGMGFCRECCHRIAFRLHDLADNPGCGAFARSFYPDLRILRGKLHIHAPVHKCRYDHRDYACHRHTSAVRKLWRFVALGLYRAAVHLHRACKA